MNGLIASVLVALVALGSSAAFAGPKCVKCGEEHNKAYQACLKSGKSQVDCNKQLQSKAQECALICKAELPLPGK